MESVEGNYRSTFEKYTSPLLVVLLEQVFPKLVISGLNFERACSQIYI